VIRHEKPIEKMIGSEGVSTKSLSRFIFYKIETRLLRVGEKVNMGEDYIFL